MGGEVTPGRTWLVTGMGANAESCEVFSATGGRGKTMKYFFQVAFGLFLVVFHGLSHHEIAVFVALDLVFFGARGCRVCNLLPRIPGLK